MLSKKVVTKQQVIYYICICYQFVLSILFVYYTSISSHKQLVFGKKTCVSRITSNILKLYIALSLLGRCRSDYLLQLSNMSCVNFEVSKPVMLHHIPDKQYQQLHRSKNLNLWIKKATFLSSLAFLWCTDKSTINCFLIQPQHHMQGCQQDLMWEPFTQWCSIISQKVGLLKKQAINWTLP